MDLQYRIGDRVGTRHGNGVVQSVERLSSSFELMEVVYTNYDHDCMVRALRDGEKLRYGVLLDSQIPGLAREELVGCYATEMNGL